MERVLKKQSISGLILSGGDTARSVCQRLGAVGIDIRKELEAGIPYGLMVGGEYHGLAVVTKAGAFGNEGSLSRAVEQLHRKKEYK